MSATASNIIAGLGILDVFCLGVVLFSCLLGGWRGLVFEAIALFAWIAAFGAAQWGSVIVETFWPWQWLADNGKARHLASFALVFVVTLLLLGWLASAARAGVRKTGLRVFDRALGMGFGLLRAVLLLWVLTVVVWLTPLHKAAWWQQSYSAPWLDSSLRALSPWLPAALQQWLPPALRSTVNVGYSSLLLS